MHAPKGWTGSCRVPGAWVEGPSPPRRPNRIAPHANASCRMPAPMPICLHSTCTTTTLNVTRRPCWDCCNSASMTSCDSAPISKTDVMVKNDPKRSASRAYAATVIQNNSDSRYPMHPGDSHRIARKACVKLGAFVSCRLQQGKLGDTCLAIGRLPSRCAQSTLPHKHAGIRSSLVELSPDCPRPLAPICDPARSASTLPGARVRQASCIIGLPTTRPRQGGKVRQGAQCRIIHLRWG